MIHITVTDRLTAHSILSMEEDIAQASLETVPACRLIWEIFDRIIIELEHCCTHEIDSEKLNHDKKILLKMMSQPHESAKSETLAIRHRQNMNLVIELMQDIARDWFSKLPEKTQDKFYEKK